MASEFAWRIAEQALNGSGLRTEHIKVLKKATTHIADAELQEVREVLPLLATKCYASFKGEFCWCRRPTGATRPNGDSHDTTCQRARALMARLVTDHIIRS